MKKLILTLNCILVTLLANTQAPQFKWGKQLGGTSEDDAYAVTVDASGNVYTAGVFNGTADFDPNIGILNLTSAGFDDIFITKLDASGNLVWAKKMGGPSDDEVYAIAVDGAGNVYTTGQFNLTADFDPNAGTANLTSAGATDVFVSKLDVGGNFVWAKRLGGVSGDYVNSIDVDGAGNIYTTGQFNATADFDPNAGTSNLVSAGGDDLFISKLDASGSFVWAKGIGSGTNESGKAITVDAFGNVYVTGAFEGTVDFDPGTAVANLAATGSTDIFILKLNAVTGNYVWAKNMGGPLAACGGGCIALDAAGSILISGIFLGTADFDPGAGIVNLTSAGIYDVFIAKYNSTGNFAWAKRIGGIEFDITCGIAVDDFGSVYTTGAFGGIVDFDPSVTGTNNITAIGTNDVFISKLDASGNFAWARNMGGTASSALGFGIALDAAGNIYTAGYIKGIVDLDPGTGVLNLTSLGGDDAFVQKMGQTGFGINDYSNNNSIIIFPNPTHGLFNVVVSNPATDSRIEIYNSLGALVYQQGIVTETNTVELNNESDGLYFVKVYDGDSITATKRILKTE